MLILNTPSNPTGGTYSAAQHRKLGDVLKRHPDVLILTDEIYEHLVYDGVKAASFAAACPELYDRTITCNGMSKGYVMTGWRLGFAGGPREIIEAMDTLQSQNLGSPSSIAQAAAIVALRVSPDGRGRTPRHTCRETPSHSNRGATSRSNGSTAFRGCTAISRRERSICILAARV
jgi:aspartate aminotransferase